MSHYISFRPLRNLITLGTCFLSILNYAHAGTNDSLKKPDISRLINQYENSSVYRNSSFYNWHLMDSCSRINDSTATAYYFQKINPYELVWSWQNTVRPDTFLSQYSLTQEDKDRYIAIYLKTLRATRSADYIRFRQMDDEDNAIRKSFVENAGPDTYKKLSERRWKADQEHAQYLYEYVQKNGWPSFENGAMYAFNIAMRDEARRDFYVSYLMDPNSKGTKSMRGTDFLYEYYNIKNYMEAIMEAVGLPAYSSIAISDMLNGAPSKEIVTVKQALNDGKKHRIYYVFAAPNEDEMKNWYQKNSIQKHNVIESFQQELKKVNPESISDPSDWQLTYMPANKTQLLFVMDR